jgi:hypothetical protein
MQYTLACTAKSASGTAGGFIRRQPVIRGTRAISYTNLATVYTALGIRVRPTGPTRPEGAPCLVPSPAQAFCTACGEHWPLSPLRPPLDTKATVTPPKRAL